MYAKLKFKSTTLNWERNQCIVKAITDCYDGVGPANFDGYRGLDSAHSKFYSTDSSHWTFAPETDLGYDSIGADAGLSTEGAQYSLKCTYDTGHTVYADIRLQGNLAQSNIYNGVSTYSYGRNPTRIIPRNRVGTALEYKQTGNTSTTSDNNSEVYGGPGHYYGKDIHIFADQTKLALLGSNWGNVNSKTIQILANHPQPTQQKYRDKLNGNIADSNVPCYLYYLDGGATGNSGLGYAQAYENGGIAGTWTQTTLHGPFIMFPGNIRNENSGTKYRNVMTFSNSEGYWFGDTSNETRGIVDDDVTAKPTATNFDYLNGISYSSRNGRLGGDSRRWGSSSFREDDVWNAVGGIAGLIKDSNGNPAIPLLSMHYDWYLFGGNEVNMSDKPGFYQTITNAGFWGDSADIDGRKFQYFPLSTYVAVMLERK